MSAPATKAFTFIPRGAIIQRFLVGGKNLVLGFSDPAEYENNPAYFGAAIGRVANRLSQHSLRNVNGQTYILAANNGPASLHGGNIGWDKLTWTHTSSSTIADGNKSVDVYTLISPHLDENYPGEVRASVTYTQYTDASTGAEVLEQDFSAVLTDNTPADVAETALNLTNHSYFQLSDGPTIEGTEITLCTNQYLQVDEFGLPTGATNILSYPGITPNTPFTLGATEPDIDDCFVVSPSTASSIPLDTRSSPLVTVVKAHHPQTGLHLEVATTEPAFQFYTGKYIDVDARKDGSVERRARAGFCVEPSRYVDAANVAEWRAQSVVGRGQVYGSRIVYRGWRE